MKPNPSPRVLTVLDVLRLPGPLQAAPENPRAEPVGTKAARAREAANAAARTVLSAQGGDHPAQAAGGRR